MTFEYFILSIGNTGTCCSLLINTEAACFMVKSGPCEACSQKKKRIKVLYVPLKIHS